MYTGYFFFNPAIKLSSEIQKAGIGLLFTKSVDSSKIILVFTFKAIWS